MLDVRSICNEYARYGILLLFLIYPLFVNAQVLEEQISLHVKHTSLIKTIKLIEQEINEECHFFCTTALIENKNAVTVKFNKVTLREVLDSLLHVRNVEWELTENKNTIMLKEKAAQPAIQAIKAKNQPDTVFHGAINLDEKEVIGYVNTTSRFNTGNVTTVKAKDIEKQPVNNPLLALQGRVSGMFIAQTGGIAGKEIKVQIRGKNSLMNGTDPLHVIDGIPITPVITEGLGSPVWGPKASALAFINPDDIERIDVLKDADATAIYGSKGANGVILITTKKPSIGKLTFTTNVNIGWEAIPKRLHLLNTRQYLTMRREAFDNDHVTPNEHTAEDFLVWDTTRYTDWQKKIIGNNALVYTIQTAVGAGNEQIQYLLSGNYQREGTVFPGAFKTEKGAVHLSATTVSADSSFRTTFTGNYSTNHAFLPYADMMQFIFLPPNAPAINHPDGSLNFSWVNPYISLIGPLFNATMNNLMGNVQLSYRLGQFTFKTSLGNYRLDGESVILTPISSYAPGLRGTKTGSAVKHKYVSDAKIQEPQINWDGKLWDGELDVLIGGTLQRWSEDREMISATGYKEDALLGNLQYATAITGQSANIKYRYGALFGRVGYQLYSKYILHLSMRRDASSRFGKRKRRAVFGAVGAGWIFNQEKFIDPDSKVLSFGKLRVSYGTTGLDQLGDYQYLSQYERVGGTYQGVVGLQPSSMPNEDFAWELTKKLEGGIELGFFRDRLFLNISKYYYISTSQLVNYRLPELTGAGSMLGNIDAKIRNTGWEFDVHGQLIKRKLEWSAMFNLSLPKNKLVSYPGDAPDGIKDLLGVPLTQVNVYKSMGTDPATGAYLFDDGTGHGVTARDGLPKMIPVNLAPVYFGGVENTFCYGHWELNVFLQFVKQKGMKDEYDGIYMPGYVRNQDIAVMDRWQVGNTSSDRQRFTQNAVLRNGYLAALNSDLYYGDASYVRLKNLNLSCRFHSKRLHIQDANVYVQGQNIFMFTAYKGMDAELQTRQVLPPLRVIRFGMQVRI